jgi:hypothetical protein
MATRHPTIPIGAVSFAEIKISPEALGHVIATVLRDVRLEKPIVFSDIKIYKTSEGAPPVDVMAAVEAGAKFFDACYYFGSSDVTDFPFAPLPAGSLTGEAAVTTARQNLMVMAVWCMIRGAYPSGTETTLGAHIPAFIKNIMHWDGSGAALAHTLASFELPRIGMEWLRRIEWGRLPVEVQQRLALGMAGYRLFTPFRLLRPRANASPEALAANQVVQSLMASGATWDIFPPTRNPIISSNFGSLNKCLESLMLHIFDAAQIQELVGGTMNILFRMPVDDKRYHGWKNWTMAHVPVGMVKIFPQNDL